MPGLNLETVWAEVDREKAEFADCSYQGRVLGGGLNEGCDMVYQFYALTSRSSRYRNRILVDYGDGSVWVEPVGGRSRQTADSAEAALGYYQAAISANGVHVVSNGDQTAHVHKNIVEGIDLATAIEWLPKIRGIELSKYEPDEQNTPRITLVTDLRNDAPTPFGLGIVRKSPDSDEPIYETYTADSLTDLPRGIGFLLRTYLSDGQPPPSYDQSPSRMRLEDDVLHTKDRIWHALHHTHRLALVVRAIDLETGKVKPVDLINNPD